MTHFDVAVIGSGPAGEGAAMQCAKDGKRVAIIELNPELGGECLHRGTIPSKALRHSIQRYIESMSNPLVKAHAAHRGTEPDYPALLAAARTISRPSSCASSNTATAVNASPSAATASSPKRSA